MAMQVIMYSYPANRQQSFKLHCYDCVHIFGIQVTVHVHACMHMHAYDTHVGDIYGYRRHI